jgi:hypothetical protein
MSLKGAKGFTATIMLLYGGWLHAQSAVKKHPTKPATSYTDQYAYEKAISTYINAAFKPQQKRPDTLLIVRNIHTTFSSLPPVIDDIGIKFLPDKAAQQWKRNKTGQICLNVIGWPEKTEASFIVVSFIDWKPQHNCHLHFVLNGSQQLVCDSLHFEYPYKK